MILKVHVKQATIRKYSNQKEIPTPKTEVDNKLNQQSSKSTIKYIYYENIS